MKNFLAICGISLIVLSPAPGSAASPDVFSGIYSVTDPATGAEVDVMKIRPYSNGYGVFSYLGGSDVQRGAIKAAEIGDASAKVRTLSVEGAGTLYHAPGGVESPVGPSDTSYIAKMMGLGVTALKRRPLGIERERGINGIHTYAAQADEREVTVRVLNYSASPLQLGVVSTANGKNVVDTDPVNAHMASARNCCFYLPERWNPSLRVNLEYRAPADSALKTAQVAVSRYDSPQDFDVVVNADGGMELLFDPEGSGKRLPQPTGVK